MEVAAIGTGVESGESEVGTNRLHRVAEAVAPIGLTAAAGGGAGRAQPPAE